MVATVTGYNIINRFQTLIGYMQNDKQAFPQGVIGPLNQTNVVTWIQWLKPNWAMAKGYNIYNWLKDKGWFYSPIGAFFQQMAGSTGNAIIKNADWLASQNDDQPVNTTVIIGDVVQLTPTNLRKMFNFTVDAMEWWNKRVAVKQLGGQYLDVIVENMAPVDAKNYRVPTFYNPQDEADESGIWWKFMKDTGWNALTNNVLSLSMQQTAIAKQKSMAEAQRWSAVAKTLGWINMSEPARQLQDKVQEFYKKFQEAQNDIAVSQQVLAKNPSLKGKYSSQLNNYATKVQDIGIDAYQKAKPFNIWPGPAPQSLGAITVGIMAAKAGIALAALGVITLYINHLVNVMSGANTLKNEIIKDANNDAKKSLANIDEMISIIKQQIQNGQITAAEGTKQIADLEKQKNDIRQDMNANAKESGKGFLQQATVAGMVGIAGLIAWKVM